MIILHRISVCMMLSLGLTSCSSNGSTAAPISNVRGSQNVNTYNGTSKEQIYKRSYSSIPKGSYNGDTYKVKRGDTLFYIAWITGNDFRDLAQRNNIAQPYNLKVGQVIKIGNGDSQDNSNLPTVANTGNSTVSSAPSQNNSGNTRVANQSAAAYHGPQSKQNVGKKSPSSGSIVQAVAVDPVIMPAETLPTSSSANNTTPVSSWAWPANGNIIDNFSLSDGGNKGIDLAGSRGQPILATADGRVVYAGNALRGYGNLIIIKHNDDYLSAYAHNDTMLVREQQQVTAGQKIATMGSTGTSSARLHFEIRYKGKSVNPLRYLPQR